ncbi:hypothetical protein C6W22_18120 [Bacillus atrophaeus]|uniref:SagB/ThcOx family dehydrogenase n=1 Tax=Bacillus atrophaeus TaxID=1452 RepID=UPI000D03503B|nr:SagB/ThcOx family dehydrogenase [Bacillus atrophaeus]MEC1901478.1 SagB/ThcOx family dehydrogenase [Bacillus atrophaeus]MEC2396883.1 SagB/ThcOx family dehydrogenase [Bacillus atrophaeus]MED4436538.1 SagB/ThcOx family dehydrogenase [Bacillus atrophaeus]MED4564608.1 SagB/ThcOx family dehydrogenase [Bacillus atrophaeus]MED4574815.1 SagB/ThcOx family dehydrogenase [Bacillus atrophaeus]
MINLEDKLYLNAGIRIKFNDDSWELTDLLNKKRNKVNTLIVMVISVFSHGESIDNSYKMISRKINIELSEFISVVKNLVDSKILVDGKDSNHLWASEVIEEWSKKGWEKSVDYHLLTYDYPFLDYKKDGQLKDVYLMEEYAEKEVDHNRGKKYKVGKIKKEIKVDSTINILKNLSASYKEGLNADTIAKLMSSIFGVLRKRRITWENVSDLVKKTNPSGGSRHPSEGYLFNISIDNLEKGIYHFSSLTSTLDIINDLPEEDYLKKAFAGPLRASFKPKAFIVITSVFERNMYRYREPRTFRTIFMDVGHIVENISKTGDFLGMNIYPHQGIDEEMIENILGINYLEEGAIMGIAVGGEK